MCEKKFAAAQDVGNAENKVNYFVTGIACKAEFCDRNAFGKLVDRAGAVVAREK